MEQDLKLAVVTYPHPLLEAYFALRHEVYGRYMSCYDGELLSSDTHPDTRFVVACQEQGDGTLRVVGGKKLAIKRPGSDQQTSMEHDFKFDLRDTCRHIQGIDEMTVAEQGSLFLDKRAVRDSYSAQHQINRKIMDVAREEGVHIVFSETFRKHSAARLIEFAESNGYNYAPRPDIRIIYEGKLQLMITMSPLAPENVPLRPPHLRENNPKRKPLRFAFVERRRVKETTAEQGRSSKPPAPDKGMGCGCP